MHKKETAEHAADPAGAPRSRPTAKDTLARAKRLGRPDDVPSLALIKDSTRENYYKTYREIFVDGALDKKTKELIAIGVSAATGCEGCLMGHIRKARAMGFTLEQIKEAIGVAFAVGAATIVDHTDVVAALMGIGEGDEHPDPKDAG